VLWGPAKMPPPRRILDRILTSPRAA